MLIPRKDVEALRADAREVARLTGENAVLRSQLADAQTALEFAHKDLKAERTAKDKLTASLLDRLLQKNGQKPISEPPVRAEPQQQELKLNAAQETERDLWRTEYANQGMNHAQVDELYTKYLKGEFDPFGLTEDTIG